MSSPEKVIQHLAEFAIKMLTSPLRSSLRKHTTTRGSLTPLTFEPYYFTYQSSRRLFVPAHLGRKSHFGGAVQPQRRRHAARWAEKRREIIGAVGNHRHAVCLQDLISGKRRVQRGIVAATVICRYIPSKPNSSSKALQEDLTRSRSGETSPIEYTRDKL